MIEEKFAISLNAFLRRRPFRPFVIQFISGEHLKVGHPEVVVIEPSGVVRFNKGRAHRLFDESSVCQLLDEEE